MTRHILPKALLAAGILSAIGSVQAAEFRVNGFASIVGGKTIDDSKSASNPLTAPGVLDTESTYLAAPTFETDPYPTRNDSAFYDDDINFKPETTLGLQLSADLGQDLSFTAQLTAQGANDFDAEVEWLYVSYNLTSDFNIKAGRQRLPLFMYSDYLDVGYAYHWIRAPMDVYDTAFSSYEGVSATYSFSLGNWDNSILGYYGAGDEDQGIFGEFNLDDLTGIVLSSNYDWLQLRASYHQADGESPDIYPAGSTRPFADNEEEELDFVEFGFMTNFGQVFFGGEYTVTSFDEPIATFSPLTPTTETGADEIINWMVTTGIRLGNWTPHITYSEATNEYKTTDLNGDGIETAGAFNNQDDVRETIIIGVRYDFHPSAALKIEYTDSSDESDDAFKAVYGERNEVSTLAVGIDLMF